MKLQYTMPEPSVYDFVAQPAKRFLEEALVLGNVACIPAGTVLYHVAPPHSGGGFGGPFYGSNPLIATYGSKLTGRGSRSMLRLNPKFAKGAVIHCVAFKKLVKLATPLPIHPGPSAESPHLAKYKFEDRYPGTDLDNEAFELMFYINGGELGTWHGKPPPAVSDSIAQTVLRIDTLLVDLDQFRAHPHVATTVIKWILASRGSTVSWFEPSVDDCNALAVAMFNNNPTDLSECIELEAHYFSESSFGPTAGNTLFLHPSVLNNPKLAAGVPELHELTKICPRLAAPQWWQKNGSTAVVNLSQFQPYAAEMVTKHPQFTTGGPQLQALVEATSASDLCVLFYPSYVVGIRYDFRNVTLSEANVRKLVREVWGVTDCLHRPILPENAVEQTKWNYQYSQWETDICKATEEVLTLLKQGISVRLWMEEEEEDVFVHFISRYRELKPTEEAWQVFLDDACGEEEWLPLEYLLDATRADDLPQDKFHEILSRAKQDPKLTRKLKKALTKAKRNKNPEEVACISQAQQSLVAGGKQGAVSSNPLNLKDDARSITEAVAQMYEDSSSEFVAYDRPVNALRAAKHVFADHAKAHP